MLIGLGNIGRQAGEEEAPQGSRQEASLVHSPLRQCYPDRWKEKGMLDSLALCWMRRG